MPERGTMNLNKRARRIPDASSRAAAAIHRIPVLRRRHPVKKVSPSISRNSRILPFPAMPDIVLLTVSMQATATSDWVTSAAEAAPAGPSSGMRIRFS